MKRGIILVLLLIFIKAFGNIEIIEFNADTTRAYRYGDTINFSGKAKYTGQSSENNSGVAFETIGTEFTNISGGDQAFIVDGTQQNQYAYVLKNTLNPGDIISFSGIMKVSYHTCDPSRFTIRGYYAQDGVIAWGTNLNTQFFVAAPDLSITISAPDSAIVDQPIDVVVTIRNTKNYNPDTGKYTNYADSTVKVQLTFPWDAVFISDFGDGTFDWTSKTLTINTTAGGTHRHTIRVKYRTSGNKPQSVKFLSSSANYVCMTKDRDTKVTRVSSNEADLSVDISAPSTAQAGDTITYTVSGRNNGSGTANSVSLTINLPSELINISYTQPSGWSCSLSGNRVSCSKSNMENGETFYMTIKGRIDIGTSGKITATASITSSTNDNNTSNNSDSVTTTVTPPPTGKNISGYVINDVNHNSVKDSGEGGLGQAVYVKLCSVDKSSVIKTVEADQTSGYWEITGVSKGDYVIVESKDSSSSCNPSDLDGWISVNGNEIEVKMSDKNIEGIVFADFNGRKVEGQIVNDYNKNLNRDTGEPLITNVDVKACSDETCSTVIDQTYSSDGKYTLYIPNSYTSYVLKADLSEEWIKVGENSDSLYYIHKAVIVPDLSVSTLAGSSFTLPHKITVYSYSDVNLSVPSVLIAFADNNCDGIPEEKITNPVIESGDITEIPYTKCIILKGFVSSDEDRDEIPYEVSISSEGKTDTVLDTVLVEKAVIKIRKYVRNVSKSEDFTDRNAGKPSDVLEYKIEFENISTEEAKDLLIVDKIPEHTQFLEDRYSGKDVEIHFKGVRQGEINDIPDTDSVVLEKDTLKVYLTHIRPGDKGYIIYQVKIK